MPQPIIPVHQLNNLDSLFNQGADENYEHLIGSFSTIQKQFFDEPSQKTAAKTSESMINHLEVISKEEEDLITVANSLASSGRSNQIHYRVPTSISDSELIGLKTQGLVLGSGRVVTFTDKAKVALREKWLVAENKLKQERTKNGFEHPMKTAESGGKFVRTSERKRKIITTEE